MREICKIGYWWLIYVGFKLYKRDLVFLLDMCVLKKIVIDFVYEKLENEIISRVFFNVRMIEGKKKK